MLTAIVRLGGTYQVKLTIVWSGVVVFDTEVLARLIEACLAALRILRLLLFLAQKCAETLGLNHVHW